MSHRPPAGQHALLWLVNVLYGRAFTDLCYGSSPSGAALAALALRSDGFEIETEMAVRAVRAACASARSRASSCRAATASRTSAPWRDGWRVLAAAGERVRPRLPAGIGSAAPASPRRRAAALTSRPVRRVRRRPGRGRPGELQRAPSVTQRTGHPSAHTPERRWDRTSSRRSARCARRRPPPAEIVVVVDHNDELLERARAGARRRAAPCANVERARPVGRPQHRRRGGAAARSSPSSTTTPSPSPTGSSTCSRAYDDPRVLGVGGAVVPRWDGGRPGAGSRPSSTGSSAAPTAACPRPPAPVRNLIGANMSFRRDVLDAVGGFRDGRRPRRRARRSAARRPSSASARGGASPAAIVLYEPRRRRPPPRAGASARRWRYFAARCYAEGRSKAQVCRLAGARRGAGHRARLRRRAAAARRSPATSRRRRSRAPPPRWPAPARSRPAVARRRRPRRRDRPPGTRVPRGRRARAAGAADLPLRRSTTRSACACAAGRRARPARRTCSPVRRPNRTARATS